MVIFLIACGVPTALDGTPTPDVATPVVGTPTPPTPATPEPPDYAITADDDGSFEAVHPENQMTIRFSEDGSRLSAVTVELEMASPFMARHQRPAVDAPEDLSADPFGLQEVPQHPPALSDRLTYEGPISTWYAHDRDGLRFGMEVASAPEGPGELVLYQPVDTGDRLVNPFVRPSSIVWGSGQDLVELEQVEVVDADGFAVPFNLGQLCRSELECGMLLRLDDNNARFPLSVSTVINPAARIECDMDADDDGVAVDTLSAGDLLVTEIMPNPDSSNDNFGEWFEIYNNHTHAVNLQDLVVWDAGNGSPGNGNEFTINDCIEVAPGGYAVIGVSTNTMINGGVTVDYAVSRSPTTIQIANSSSNGDEIRIGYRTDPTDDCNDGDCELLDGVDYDAAGHWPHIISGRGTFNPIGASFTLDPDSYDATLNDDSANWCDGVVSFGAGDFGTPGAANDSCDLSVYFDFTWEDEEDEVIFEDCTFIELSGVDTMATGNGGDGTYVRYTHSSDAGQVLEWTYMVNQTNHVEPVTWRSVKLYGDDTFATGTAIAIPDIMIAEAGTWTESTDMCAP